MILNSIVTDAYFDAVEIQNAMELYHYVQAGICHYQGDRHGLLYHKQREFLHRNASVAAMSTWLFMAYCLDAPLP